MYSCSIFYSFRIIFVICSFFGNSTCHRVFMMCELFLLVDESTAAENGISSVTAVMTEADDYTDYNVTIDKLALSTDDAVHVDG